MDFTTNATEVPLPLEFSGAGSRVSALVDQVPPRDMVRGPTVERWPISEEGRSTGSLHLTIATDPPNVDHSRFVESLPGSIAANWVGLVHSKLGAGAFGRLVRLAAGRIERHEPKKAEMKTESLRAFLDFWLRVRDFAVEPEFALAPDGCLYAEWFRSPRRHLDVKFSGRAVIFGVIDGARVLEGTDSVANVASILVQHRSKPLTWRVKK